MKFGKNYYPKYFLFENESLDLFEKKMKLFFKYYHYILNFNF